ncbi:recombinase family protein, partial [Mycobacterium tuberculosis]|nr:recombinase family protein [Mycobacterium tuberculosis]
LGVSAFDKSHVRDGQLGTFLAAIEAGKVPVRSYLLVESLDRISRAKITDALEIFMAIINRGVILVTLADGMEYSKDKIDKQ